MQLISLMAVWGVWSLAGAALLVWAGEKDRIQVALLALVTGAATAAFAVSTASLVGFSIQMVAWPLTFVALLVVAAALFLLDEFNLPLVAGVLTLTLATSGLSVALVGRPLVEVGNLWQGLMNGDAATNAMGAQYFIHHAFYDLLDANSVVGGTDYSPLSTSLYVASGHRFADVMLLGFSAVLANLYPDQIYMAHAMLLPVALILVCASLVYIGRRKLNDALVAIVLLSVSSVGAYSYLNELISQTGGTAFMVLTMIFWTRLLDIDRDVSERKRSVLSLAIVAAALLRYYPEVAPLLGLAMFVSAAIVAQRYDVARARWLIRAVLVATVLLLAVSNVSLPNSIAHILNTLSIGTVRVAADATAVAQGKGIMDYAFTPDAFPLSFGFIRFREEVADPSASVYVTLGCVIALGSLWAVWKFRKTYVALASIFASLCVTFCFLWFKGEEFGTFKAMLLLQPFACLAATVVLAKLVPAPAFALTILAGGFALLNMRVTTSYVQSATSDIHPVPTLIQRDILNSIVLIAREQKALSVDMQSHLLHQFVALRRKSVPTFFEADAPRPIPDAFDNKLASYYSTLHQAWFDGYLTMKQRVRSLNEKDFETVAFGCGPEPLRSSTFERRRASVNAALRTVYAGGAIQPFNRTQHADTSFIVVDRENPIPLIAQRESSLGRWELSANPQVEARSVYFAEYDPMGQVSTMSAVGRFLLLEVINADSQPIALRVAFSRSFFGPSGAKLSKIQIHGATSVSVAGYGAGAIDVTSPLVKPCVVGTRNYLMIDFGSVPEEFKKSPPLLYRALGIRYTPDSRRSVGFLRDISIAKKVEDPSTFQPQWAPKSTRDSVVGYEGIFEDGWLSEDARIIVRPESGKSLLKLRIEVDPSLLVPGKTPPIVVIRDASGTQISVAILSTGVNTIDLPVAGSALVDIRLTGQDTLELPGGDGRRVLGRLSSASWE